MNVVMVGPYPVAGAATGGIEAVAAALAGALHRMSGIELHVVTVSPSAAPSCHGGDSGGPVIHTVLPSGRWRRLTLYRGERAAIVRRLRELQPDLVHVQGQNFYALAGLDAGLPTVITLHGMLFREAQIIDRRSHWTERLSKQLRGRFNASFESTSLRRATDLIIISPYVAKSVAGRTRARLHPIDNPIDDSFFTVPDAEEAGRLFFAGALEPRKGLHHLIEAVRLLRDSGGAATIHIAGATLDTGYAAALERAVLRAGLSEMVRFLGVINQSALLEQYAQAALIVMASQEESSPMLLQQAMAAGKAVVAPRVGGIPYLVEDGLTGRVVPPADPAALAAVLGELLADRALRRRMGEEGRRQAEVRFRATGVAARTCEVYRDVLARAAGRAARAPLAVLGEGSQ